MQANVSVCEAWEDLEEGGRDSQGQTWIDGNTLGWVRVYESFWCCPPELCAKGKQTLQAEVGEALGLLSWRFRRVIGSVAPIWLSITLGEEFWNRRYK